MTDNTQAALVSKLDDLADQLDIELLKITGHDNAIVGLVDTFDGTCIAYDQEKILENLTERDGMTMEEAVEYFDFNIAGAYMGRGTPVFFTPLGHVEQ